MNCISCKTEHDENFCPNCGEKKDTRKITFASILEDAFSSVTNMDKGFLFNLKALILRPQKITTDYIRGKRKGILNPVSFLILSVTLYLIVITLFRAPKELAEIKSVPKSEIRQLAYDVGQFIRAYFKYFWILAIVPLGLSLKLIFGKYNYIEHLAISSFIIGQATIAGVISFLIFDIPLIFDPIVYIAMFWLVFKIFKKDNNTIESSLLSFTALALFGIQLTAIIILIALSKYGHIL